MTITFFFQRSQSLGHVWHDSDRTRKAQGWTREVLDQGQRLRWLRIRVLIEWLFLWTPKVSILARENTSGLRCVLRKRVNKLCPFPRCELSACADCTCCGFWRCWPDVLSFCLKIHTALCVRCALFSFVISRVLSPKYSRCQFDFCKTLSRQK